MNPGDMKQRLIFQQKSGLDEDGFPTKEKTTYAKAWGELKTLRGGIRYSAARANMEHNREFSIRYQKKLEDGIRPHGLIVIWKGIEHDIESIENDDGLNTKMTVLVKAVS